ncbi:MAG: MFS transporter [Lactobacillaceae bacterium]|jgi:MFS family permease|nr:MFS transporter [Lactobacillaceae bacterium]
MEAEPKLQKFSLSLLGSNFASIFGDTLYRFALNWFLVASYGNAKVIGWLSAFGFVIYLLNDIYVGALLDRFNRKWLLVGADLGGALGLLSLAWFVNPAMPQIWLLALLTLILNIDISFAYPASRAIIPDVIAGQHISRFNAWASAAFSTGQSLGPLVGGLLLQLKWIDLRSFLLLYGVMLLVTAGINLGIRYHPTPFVKTNENFLTSMVLGYKYVVAQPKLFESMLLTMWSNLFFEGFVVAMPYLVQKVYLGTAANYALMLTFSAVAGIVAALILARFPQYNGMRTLYIDFGVLAVLFIVGAFSHSIWILGALIIAFGFVRETFVIKIMTVRQQASAPEYLGRVFGISFLVTDLFVPFIAVLVGYAVGPLGRWTILLMGLILFTGMLVIRWVVYRRNQKMINA